jgi:deazaflavin-dependent oxidoreductase (nitroreductase family)
MSSAGNMPEFREPSAMEKALNRAFGLLVRLGLGLPHNYLLQVRGRKTGRLYSTPVNLLELNGKKYVVAPRGRTQWVRNAEATGEVTLNKAFRRQRFRLRPIPEAEKPPILKAYLERFATTVQLYFPVQAGADENAYRDIAPNYPVCELLPA